jgi:hypothetical protein
VSRSLDARDANSPPTRLGDSACSATRALYIYG